jgi:hypothetical protein
MQFDVPVIPLGDIGFMPAIQFNVPVLSPGNTSFIWLSNLVCQLYHLAISVLCRQFYIVCQ